MTTPLSTKPDTVTVLPNAKTEPASEPASASSAADTAPRHNPLTWLIGLYNPRRWREKGVLWSLKLMLITYVTVIGLLGIYWSHEPSLFDARSVALQAAAGDESKLAVPGYITTSALIEIGETLLDKPGGYLGNDISVPSLYLDNMPSWEFGVLTELRDSVRTLRNDFGRAQSQSQEDRDLMQAEAKLHYDPYHWILPRTEDEYRQGLQALHNYRDRLALGRGGDARFFVRADNLNIYLAMVEKRLGSLAYRLSANVREMRFQTTDTALVVTAPVVLAEGESPLQTNAISEITENTPWREIDNVFYEARGYIWALLHTLKAIEIEFHDVLVSKKALTPLQRIIHKLENTQQAVWSPLIFNNSGFGMLTNHSLVMTSYLSRANAAIIDLRILLTQG